MAYLHCHNCNWQQDDFWSESYNPIRYLLNWENDLLIKDLDEPWTDDKNTIRETGCTTWREIIAWKMENAASSVREMLFRTEQDFSTDREHPCPQCGKVNWDID